MRVPWLRRRKTCLLVGLLLLPALAARLLVPPGFMPGTGADGAPTMQMCHGAGPLPTTVQPATSNDGHTPGDRAHHEAPCVFAAAGSAAPPPVAAGVHGTPQAPDAGPPTPESIIVQRALHRAQAARAPPTDSYPA
jgi:hypothetical protein